VPYINDVIENNKKLNDESKPVHDRFRASRFRFDPDQAIDLLKERIIGQEDMHDSIADMLHVVKADFGSGDRPLAVFLFVGSTGVGKTETVRVLAEAILGSADQMCRIDMNTLAQEHYTAALTGAPPGYVGSKENHTLFDFEKIEGSYSKPGIVLFDEIEKSSKEVARALLNVLDSGRLELSAGTKRLNFNNCLIFMTSNEGARELDGYRRKFEHGWRKWFRRRPSRDKEQRILNGALQKKFDLEFINRIDRIVFFEELDRRFLDDILSVELAMLNKRLSRHRVSIRLDAKARLHLIDGHDPRYGARHLRRRIRAQLEPELARAFNTDRGCEVFVASCQADGLVVRPDPA
jgi:ATP-dependent Clp protease ATP-binding subunit ClpA